MHSLHVLSHQACTGVKGALLGSTAVTGEQYLSSLSYSSSHVWRDFGIVWAWWALFTVLTIVFTCRWQQNAGSSGILVTPRGKEQREESIVDDEESQKSIHPAIRSSETRTSTSRSTVNSSVKKRDSESSAHQPEQNLARNTSIFTWRDLTYTINTASGERLLLDHVHGWVKPGMLGALMGSSGAGKTTLLDILASRKTEGTIKGSVLVDGRSLPVAFQRSAGYCEQLDVHEAMTTVREVCSAAALLLVGSCLTTILSRLLSSAHCCASHAVCRNRRRSPTSTR